MTKDNPLTPFQIQSIKKLEKAFKDNGVKAVLKTNLGTIHSKQMETLASSFASNIASPLQMLGPIIQAHQLQSKRLAEVFAESFKPNNAPSINTVIESSENLAVGLPRVKLSHFEPLSITETKVQSKVKTEIVEIDRTNNRLVVLSEIETHYPSNEDLVLIKRDQLQSVLSGEGLHDIELLKQHLKGTNLNEPEFLLKEVKYKGALASLTVAGTTVTFRKSTPFKAYRANDILSQLFKNEASKKDGIYLDELVRFITGDRNSFSKDTRADWVNKANSWVKNINDRFLRESEGSISEVIGFDRAELRIYITMP